MTVSAVLFDFDGVVGRTMEDNYAAWHGACDQMGLALEREEYFLLEGMGARRVAEIVVERNGASETLAPRLAELKDALYLRHVREVRLYDGVDDVLDVVRRAGWKTALVTGARRARITATAGTVLQRFDAVVTADDVTRTKPFPDPYLTGASALRVEPDTCVVIENAPLGIDAARAAGMRCIAVASTLDPRHLAAADVVVSNLVDVIPHLESMGAGA